MVIHNAKDNSFKLIFGNHRFFSEFLRDFIKIDALKEVKPEDIEDISERFLPLFMGSRDSDTVKRINLKDNNSLYVIAILEHQSEVDFRSSFKMLQYICLVLDAWEKEIDGEKPGSSRRKDFKYPPVLPIIFYDGTDTWTAQRNFFDRTNLNTAFEKYIPKFEYELVNLNDYSEEKIVEFGDALSIIMLIDKLRGSKGESLLSHLPSDYLEKMNLQIPEGMRKLLGDVIRVLLEKSGFSRPEVAKLAAYIEKADSKERSGMFEAVIESFIKERKEAREEGWKEGWEEGWEEGIALGEERSREKSHKEKLLIASNFKNLGVPVETITQATGLSMEEINEL